MNWNKLFCKANELQLSILTSGQSFRWHKTGENEWTGVIKRDLWQLSRDGDYLLYKRHTGDDGKSHPTSKNKRMKLTKDKELSDDVKSATDVLEDYFQLQIKLENKYDEWSKLDKNFKEKANNHPGIRILRQDPVETLFSFICSTNNNISRITKMVSNLCQEFGKEIGTIDGISYYAFPTIDRLAEDDVESTLRKVGFGYRAKYICQAAQHILEKHDANWLYSLRNASYDEAFTSLQALPGVGAKVSDCVCLMSLDKSAAVPIDTHLWQIARQTYLPHLMKQKSLTSSSYKEIGNFFRLLYGEYAGWAHTVLFVADLKKK